MKAAGFEAYGVLVSNRSNYFFAPVLQDPTRLDSNVVLVKLNGKDNYYDPGAAFAPFGLLPWGETDVTGLRLDKDGGSWVQTSLPESTESRVECKAALKLSDTGDLEGKLTTTFVGLEAMRRREEERNQDDTERKKFLEDEVKGYIPAAVEVGISNSPDWSHTDPPLVAEFNVKIPGWASSAGSRALVPVGLFSAPEKRVFDHANRVHPIYFEFPYERVDDITIELPAGWQVSSVPPPLTKDGHIIVYTFKVENQKNVLHLSRLLNVDILLLDNKYYASLRNFYHEVRRADEQQIVLQPGAATASN